jgi:flagellar protein FliO/FliZ
MSRTPTLALAALTLALALPAVGVAGDKAYLADVTPAVDGATVSVRLKIDGSVHHSVSVRPDGVQVTLEGAFVDPPKRHVPVDHPAVQEIFAYQYDPDTVRVRLLTKGVDATALKDHVSVRDEGRFLVLTVRGLPQATLVSAPAAPAPAPVAQADAPPATTTAATVPDNADRAAAARAEAMAALEKILDPAPKVEAEAPAPAVKADGGGMSALVVPHAARVPVAPKGGGAPPEAAVPTPAVSDAAAPADADAVPTAAVDTTPVADAKPAEPTPVRPLGPLPKGGSMRPDLWTSGIKMAAGLCLVLGLLLGGMALLRKVKGAGLGGRTPIRVLASASLGSRQNIVVVEVEGRRLVVGVTPGGMELLADLSAAGGPGGDAEGGPVTSLKAAPEGPFARALARAGRSGPSGLAGRTAPSGERETATALGRATTELERRVQRLKALSA